MMDVLIVGGGLCGLALAHSLQARGLNWQLLEARPRCGGRVLSADAGGGTPVDLGPTWYWPDSQPSMTRLVHDLGLDSLAQADDGAVWLLDDAGAPPHAMAFDPASGQLRDDQRPQPGALHGGARRLRGGMAALVEALQRRLPRERLQLGQPVHRLVDCGDHVRVDLGGSADAHSAPAPARRLLARRVVLCLPPRLAAERIVFDPPLPEALAATMRATPTWMASAAKAAVPCASAAWAAQGQSGNAWVTHAQAVLAESWDAGSAEPGQADAQPPGQGQGQGQALLAGFLALPAAQRAPFARSLPVLLDSQVVMLWGAAAAPAAHPALIQDWSEEFWTCTDADRLEDGAAGHPVYGDVRLQAPQWQHKLWLGGSETARHGGGYLEGALAAAARLRQALTDHAQPHAAAATAASTAANTSALTSVVTPAAAGPLATPSPSAGAPGAAASAAAPGPAWLVDFDAWVQHQRPTVFQRYRQHVVQAMAAQHTDQLTQKALLAALESFYADALAQLQVLAPAAAPAAEAPAGTPDADPTLSLAGRHALTPQVLAPFNGLADHLIAEALTFNISSCALSNFPDEHKPGGAYVRTMRRDLAAAWQGFALQANAWLQSRKV